MALPDWSTLEPPLRIPIAGKTYEIPPVSIAAAMEIEALKEKEAESPLVGDDADQSWRLIMGSAYDEMIADGVPHRALTRAKLTAAIDYQFDRDMAEQFWEMNSIPKALRALTAESENPSRPVSPPSLPGESESPTPPVSTSTTGGKKSRPTSSKRATSKSRAPLRSA